MADRIKTLKNLVALDYDAIEAYDAAIERLKDPGFAARLREFRQDHLRHTENLGAILRNMNEDVPQGPDMKRMLTEGKVVAELKITNPGLERWLVGAGVEKAGGDAENQDGD